ncbi:phosphatase PAP2 family protein [Hymenobacter psychrophilus]|uniref:PAP2 superfamily protein n=1 Tax=Hymenobacter psychrophilus TaxID=651662 RepID=A0A1H3M8P8_9BACT|nr:phosphatase PAP2 family protein [Hymenobacter psychrophilus]SDY72395.1 PAP2 superfamily protein [Hymenobacter psychrophilus]
MKNSGLRSAWLLLLLGLAQPGTAQPSASPPDSVVGAPVVRPWLTRPAVLRVAVPVVLVAAGYASRNENFLDEMKEEVREETRENFPHFRTSLDDYTRRVPLAAAYGLFAVGLKGERGVVPFSACFGLSHALSTGLVSNLKRISHTQRPDVAADFSSFPSAHTADAFLTATLLHEQFGRGRPWLSVAGYTVATATGAMRMLNDRHWLTDVVAGASIGFLSAETVWRLYPAVARLLPGHLGQKLLLLPTYAPGGTVGAVLVVR